MTVIQTTDPSTADTDLVARAQDGDVEAYAALVRRYQAYAVGLAAVVTREPAEAEDVAQEAFFKAYRALDRFRPGASFRGWLTRIVVNEARNARAVSHRRGQVHARFETHGALPKVAASAEDAAVTNQQHAAVLEVLDAQREDDRAVLLYRYVMDLSEAEMAEALECSPGTVKSRLSRALGRLRTDLRKVAPLLAASPNFGVLLGGSMAGAAGPLPTGVSHDLAAGVLQRIAASGAAPGSSGRSGRPSAPQAAAGVAAGIALVALAVTGMLLSTSQQQQPRNPTAGVSTPASAPAASVQAVSPAVTPPPSSTGTVIPPPSADTVTPPPSAGTVAPPPTAVVVFGGDLTPEQRRELEAVFAAASPATMAVDSVSRDELQAALQGAGLVVDGSERAISSAAVTCLSPGEGLSVRTENVTQVPAAAYANALVAAGITDAGVIVAAPPNTPMTGETAFVGVLKAFPRCHIGQPLQASRLRVAYAQLHATADIAQDAGAWDKAAAIVLRSAQVAIDTRSVDEATLGAAVDAAALAEGVTLGAAQRSELVAVLSDVAGLDPGTYVHGYAIQQAGANEVRVVPRSSTASP